MSLTPSLPPPRPSNWLHADLTTHTRVLPRPPLKGLDLVKKFVYMMIHLTFGILTMVVASFFWRSQIGHGIFICTLVLASAWNGSGFYFQVFARSYENRLDEKLEKAH